MASLRKNMSHILTNKSLTVKKKKHLKTSDEAQYFRDFMSIKQNKTQTNKTQNKSKNKPKKQTQQKRTEVATSIRTCEYNSTQNNLWKTTMRAYTESVV